MRYANFLRELEQHGDALHTAVAAGSPDTPVPSCPRWTTQRLTGHVGRVYSLVIAAIADPSGARATPQSPPESWQELLPWWQSQHDTLIETFGTDPEAPAWLPFTGYEPRVASWARRMAHETAIHRLDAEQAVYTTSATTFDPEFAADGIDEFLMVLLPGHAGWEQATTNGSVLVHATDVDSVWSLRLTAGRTPEVGRIGSAQRPPQADTVVSGSANAVYRALWRRPTDATTVGDATLLEPLAAP